MGHLTEEEFESLKQQEGTRNAIHHDLGAMSTQTARLHKAYVNLEEDAEKFRQKLVDKYGKINVELKDGSFEVVKEEEENKE
tara:strand:- start:883 stop:1128 length:246 start_codon:yes stop_codon:yes gene_type:complete